MAKLSSSCFLLVLIFLAAAQGGLSQAGEPGKCVTSWDCKDSKSCKDECNKNYPQGYGLCVGNPKTCLCSYNCR
ncbi:conserved hypothetical protein [Ricinus communis]|uniref:Knottin scorpion toxin-like domain-containing protein n=1 Tax=Ricinus communis TaxID=3988 RepID=B9SV10_RICCO|nr:conserved hypothetical protein [Ricinus communis]